MTEFREKEYTVFEMFNHRWGLAAAGTMDHFNACTISWGSLGTLWGRPVVTIYINPSRYTYDFLRENDTFTVSFFPEAYREALEYCGTKSGRDENKTANAGLTAIDVNDSVMFKEADYTFVCHKIYEGPFGREGMAEEISGGIYKDWEPHWMFIGEVVSTFGERQF